VKETANRGYAYPECDPPYVKDAADLPLQLKNLAEAVDDDVTALQAQAADALNPPSAAIFENVALFDVSQNRFILTSVSYDNASMANIVTSSLDAPTAGLYYITAVHSYSQSASAGTQLSIQVNGAIVDTESTNTGSAGNIQITIAAVQFLAAGDAVSLTGTQLNLAGEGPAELQMTRIVAA
jgi:hypothetical protein